MFAYTSMVRTLLEYPAAGLQIEQQKQVGPCDQTLHINWMKVSFSCDTKFLASIQPVLRTCLRVMADDCDDDLVREVRQRYIRLLAAEGLDQAQRC